MGDSDDEFERKKGRDKFRRERNDYERRSDDRRRDNWDDRRPSMRGGQGGGMRSRDMWSGRGANMRDRRDMYSRQYDDRRRDRFSPGRFDGGPHPAKRMRRDWDEGGYSGMYESPFQVSNGPPGADRAGWTPRNMEVSSGPPDRGGFPERRDAIDPEHPTQPPLMTFKQFLNKQEDTISQEDAIRLFEDYKLDFRRQQINEFFLAHKEEEWFKSKYHPEECDKRQVEVKAALESRRKVFEALREKKFFEDISVDIDCTDSLIKIMDAAVILLEGGNDLDLTILDNPLLEPGERSRQNSETVTSPIKTDKKKSDDEDGEISDSNPTKTMSDSEQEPTDQTDKKEEVDEDKDKDQEKKAEPKDQTLEMTITPEQEELKKKAMEYQKQQEAAAAEAKAQRRKKKSMRKKSDYSYESDSESGSESDSDPEPAPPGLEDDATAPPGVEPEAEPKSTVDEAGDRAEKEPEGAEEDNKAKEEKEEEKPRPLHRTNSIFLRNLAPTITKQEVEAMCRRYPGFIRVALQDPQPERRFLRRGWVTFSKECNIKDVCWTLNNIRLRDCELGATLNRELKQRIRMANGLTVHKQVMRNDIKMAAKIIQILDKKWGLWEDEGEEKKDNEKELQFGFVTKNPVLKNITDFLVEEGSFEEEELIGESDDDKKDANHEITVEKDLSLCLALDKMVLYLRLVHSIDYYAANEYPNEDEMPHRCGIMHARGEPPGPTAKMTQTDVNEWMGSFEKKIKPFMEAALKISDTEAAQLGQKDPDVEVEKFVQANTQELSRDKWLCPLSGKKFKGPEFVRKHIYNKHGEKVDEVRKEVKFFNNYLVDPKRPALPEHPSSRPKPPPPAAPAASPQAAPPQRADPYGNNYTSPGGAIGFSQSRPPLYGGGAGAAYQSPFSVRDNRPPPDNFRRSNFGGAARPYRRSDPRQLIQYTDLDAPDDGDIF
ncbi:serrate RNA effector molecule homolog isoform X3 [Aplysia californica]|uniref:Serrate RNA effector molecule homolog isoform X3 n=1 Tax=Aplysia californica TaxID=6500 RepID=A0ABM1A2S8_APLCA|nr:serrate RNA effector molecule homolog isoform X3 [Aplysia californica]